MTVDELVSLIQQGRDDLICDLWKELRGLVAWYAVRFHAHLVASRGAAPVEVEDLIQSGFIAMVEALPRHDPERGSFTTFFRFYIRKAFHSAIGRSEKHDPLNNYIPLDAPVNDDEPEGATRLEYIPDPRDYYSGIDESIFLEQLHKALETALNAIPAKEAAALRAEYWQGKKQVEIAEEMGCSDEWVRQLRNGGLRHIRNSSAQAQLERFLDMETPFYKNVSVEHFTRTHTSAVEAVAIWREKRRLELGESICSS